ncbi:TPA: group II intron reverse transcriptase/maturase [Legionella pneumophila]
MSQFEVQLLLKQEEILKKTKHFDIPKQLFVEAFKRVKANSGAAGVDSQSIDQFEENLRDNLYKLWNRMSSGSYFPPAVKAVPIPKKSGGERLLGIPTVGDRVCQMVVKLLLEPELEAIFLPDSYGYRANKSALEAIEITWQRCRRYPWILEFDIKGLFDNIPHDLLMKAVQKHVKNKWIILYVKRWLEAGMKMSSGVVVSRKKGTPQGGVISPILSNLFLHYAFDYWMMRHYPDVEWCRYADDGLLHCNSQYHANKLLNALSQRFKECGLELHPDKTRVVYCKNSNRKGKYPHKSFDFLGYTFRERTCKNPKIGKLFTGFGPAASKASMKAMRLKIRRSNLRSRTDLNLDDIASWFNPIIQGWLNYYGKFNRSELYKVWRHFNQSLMAWVMKKYKPFRKRKTKAGKFLERIAKERADLFAHWRIGMIGVFI